MPAWVPSSRASNYHHHHHHHHQHHNLARCASSHTEKKENVFLLRPMLVFFLSTSYARCLRGRSRTRIRRAFAPASAAALAPTRLPMSTAAAPATATALVAHRAATARATTRVSRSVAPPVVAETTTGALSPTPRVPAVAAAATADASRHTRVVARHLVAIARRQPELAARVHVRMWATLKRDPLGDRARVRHVVDGAQGGHRHQQDQCQQQQPAHRNVHRARDKNSRCRVVACSPVTLTGVPPQKKSLARARPRGRASQQLRRGFGGGPREAEFQTGKKKPSKGAGQPTTTRPSSGRNTKTRL